NNFMLGNLNSGRSDMEQGLARFDPRHRDALLRLTDGDQFVIWQAHLSPALAALGYVDQSRARREMALAEARRLGHAFTLAFALSYRLSFIDVRDSNVDARLVLTEELLALSREHGFALWQAAATIRHGWCLTMLEREAEGMAQLTQGMTAFRAT